MNWATVKSAKGHWLRENKVKVILQDLPTRLTAGEECILWFKFSKPGTEQAYVSIVLLDDAKQKVKAEEIQAAVGMRKQVGK